MSITQLKQCNEIPTPQLDDWGPVPKPLGEPVSQLSGVIISENKDGSEAGIWECTPGIWTRLVMDAEISTFLKGKAIFHPAQGEPIHIDAGDTVYFDANSEGTWEVIETVRKAYLTYKNDDTD
ncbi:MAG: cupin domain-containing protein [Pseudomonadales bacterium]